MPFSSLTLDQLQAACAEWQKRLRLQDWDIDIAVRRWHELDVQGRCIVTPELKHARISVRDGNDSPADCQAEYDMESVLVHEMLHIHFDAVTRDYNDSQSIRVSPGGQTAGVNAQTVALEQAFCGIVPWMVKAARVIPLEIPDGKEEGTKSRVRTS